MPEQLKVGLIGAGGVARAHLRAYGQFSERVKLVAVCDINQDAAGERAREAGAEEVFSNVDTMLQESDIDAVDICTSHDSHAPLAIAAAQAGKHVLVEKPMACSLAECREMVRAAESAGVMLMVAQVQRYSPAYRGIRKVIQSGELGSIRAIRVDAMQNGPETLRRNNWLLDGTRAGGGIVISVAVHKIDLLRYLIGEVGRVTALCRTFHPFFGNGAEDYACALLEFDNGAIGEVFGTFSAFRAPWGEMLMIFGDQGTAHAVPRGQEQGSGFVASRQRTPQLQTFSDTFGGFEPVEPDHEGLATDDGFINEILHFAECCRTGKEPISSGRDNLGTMKVVFGIYESARTGKAVELSRL